MTPSRVDHVLDALVGQAAVHYAVVTARDGTTVAEAGDLPQAPGFPSYKASDPGGPGAGPFRVRMMMAVGSGKILHVGTTQRLPRPEARQLRSVVASVV